MVVVRVPGNTMTALLASEWVTGSATAWIPVAVAVVLTLWFAYRGRLESWVFRGAGEGPG